MRDRAREPVNPLVAAAIQAISDDARQPSGPPLLVL
jgi:hypothetical protein